MDETRQRRTPTGQSQNGMDRTQQRRIMIVIAAVAVMAVVVIIGLQLLSVNPSSASPFARYENIPKNRTSDGAFVLGSPDAPITVVEFADFACPHCQDYAPQMDQFVDQFVATGKAKFEYRMFISAADPTFGPYTARLAECAEQQHDGAFWAAHDVLYERGRALGRFNDQIARTVADRLGLDYARLLNCANNAHQYDTDQQLGIDLGVQSTPTMMYRLGDSAPQFITVGDQAYDRGSVPYELLQALVQSVQ